MPYKNPEDRKAYIKRWRAENRDKVSIYKKIWRERNPDKAKTGERRRNRNRRLRVIDYYSNNTRRCARCGFGNIRALTIDHINGGGNAHRRQIGTGNRFYCWLIRNNCPAGFQILCENCNRIKEWENRALALPT